MKYQAYVLSSYFVAAGALSILAIKLYFENKKIKKLIKILSR